ncbi:hypothetical protein C7S18_13855 [Ahniella affigens]|uniref:Uncharacterized protein n=1 Tax=Ahniella affigens TaxID=2021234 RepID=A0A2P1PTQ6_9GAMM|nr:hypothetical protein [Ahniella affigens]AVP98210.1 hypothetical protein C7S18_13855 [Ahniella affigens]
MPSVVSLLLSVFLATPEACPPPDVTLLEAASTARSRFAELLATRPSFPEESGAIGILWRDPACALMTHAPSILDSSHLALARECELLLHLKPGTANRYEYLLRMPITQRQPSRIALVWLAPTADHLGLREHVLISDRDNVWYWHGPVNAPFIQQFQCRANPWADLPRWF